MANYQQIFVYFVPPKYPEPPFNLPVWSYDNVLSALLNPPACNYDNLVGAIWLEGNPAGYDYSHTGKTELREPSGVDEQGAIQGGSYEYRT